MPSALTLADLLTPERVMVHAWALSKAEALATAVALVADHEAVRDPARLAADVEAREALMSTGVGGGSRCLTPGRRP